MNQGLIAWVAAGILLITMGIRQSMGLLVSPLIQSSALSVSEISLALAISQFVWGVSQPLWGLLNGHWSTARVVAVGGLSMALALGLVAWIPSPSILLFGLGILLAAGAGAGSFSVLIGSVSQRLRAESRAMAAGFINAGGSLGQCLIAPLTAGLLTIGGLKTTLLGLAGLALVTVALAPLLSDKTPRPEYEMSRGLGLTAQLKVALHTPSYWYLHIGFLTCGFHVAFLVTHLPSEVSLCGFTNQVAATSLAIIGFTNVLGSLGAGYLGQRMPMKWILAGMYASRTVSILLYLIAPKTPETFYLFATVLGATWLATVPPTSGITAKLFGTEHLATLFGLTLISHQVGAFFGAWLGGLALLHFGSLETLWWLDAGLALLAAIINLPIQEPLTVRAAT